LPLLQDGYFPILAKRSALYQIRFQSVWDGWLRFFYSTQRMHRARPIQLLISTTHEELQQLTKGWTCPATHPSDSRRAVSYSWRAGSYSRGAGQRLL